MQLWQTRTQEDSVCECVKERQKVRDCDARLHSVGGVCMCVISWAQHQLGPLLPDWLDSTAHLDCSLLSLLLNLLSSYTSFPRLPVWGPVLVSLREWEQNSASSRRWRTFQVNHKEGHSLHLCWIRWRPPSVDRVPHQCIHPYTSRSDSEWEERRVSDTNHDSVVLIELWHSLWSPL